MLGHRPYYHRTIRKYVTIFGALFNDVFYVRETQAGAKKERQKVPIAYGPKEKWVTRIYSDPNLTKSVATTVPRMSFEMTSLTYDESRKQQSTIRHRSNNPLSASTPQSQYVGVPYNFDFSLSIYVRNIEDGLQIVEQILPFFLPDYTLTAQVSQEVDITKDIPIILKSVEEKIDFEGAFSDGTRMVTWDLQFTLKGYLFGPVSNSAIIMGIQTGNTITGGVFTNIYEDVNSKTLQKVIMTSGSGIFKEDEVVREPNRDLVGKVFSWTPSTNTAYFNSMTGVLRANDEVWGLESGAHWVVQSVEVTNQKDAQIHIYQNPITANQYSDYGYSTVITEFPDTL
jgi:hypothetical protein